MLNPGARIAANALSARTHLQRTEAGQLDGLANAELFAYDFEKAIYQNAGILTGASRCLDSAIAEESSRNRLFHSYLLRYLTSCCAYKRERKRFGCDKKAQSVIFILTTNVKIS
jgi:hypothetical protein